jgi:hypothetical protein
MPAIPPDPDPLTGLPRIYSRADGVDDACDLMAWYERVIDAREGTFLRPRVAVANAAGLNLDPHLPCFGLGTLAFDQFERSLRFWDLNRFHLCHFNTPWRNAATMLA